MTRLSNPTLRAVSVLDYLVAHPDPPARLSTLARNLGMNKATCLSILRALVLTGYVTEVEGTKEYSIGPAFLAGQAVSKVYWLGLEPAVEASRALSSELGLCADVHVRVGGHLTVVERSGPLPGPLEPVIRVGLRKPFVAPLGVCFISWSTPKEFNAWLAPWSISNRDGRTPDGVQIDAFTDRMRRCIEACRARGYTIETVTAGQRRFQEAAALEADRPYYEEFSQLALQILTSAGMENYAQIDVDDAALVEVGSITSPVVSADRRANVAISLVGFDHPLSGAQVKELGSRLANATRRISIDLGAVFAPSATDADCSSNGTRRLTQRRP
jgi:DNA-binding IclR family transcriptional regulator